MIIRILIFSLIVLLAMGLCYSICWILGKIVMTLFHLSRNYGVWCGRIAIVCILFILAYGLTIGFNKLTIREFTFESKDLPEEFDGYRIVHISDAHLGTYANGKEHLLERNIDSINALKPDLVLFTGDIQNLKPSEIEPMMEIIKRMKAKDGIYSVLGNHDYSIYLRDASAKEKAESLKKTISLEKELGWTVLMNENARVYRDCKDTICEEKPSIVIAGMENDGDGKKFPRYGNLTKTMNGTKASDFIIMLQHDPTHWRDTILKNSNAQLTLSGHTHAGQFMLFGWSPVEYFYEDWAGVTNVGERAINVSTGMGGFIPFRFGIPGEIVLITLKKK